MQLCAAVLFDMRPGWCCRWKVQVSSVSVRRWCAEASVKGNAQELPQQFCCHHLIMNKWFFLVSFYGHNIRALQNRCYLRTLANKISIPASLNFWFSLWFCLHAMFKNTAVQLCCCFLLYWYRWLLWSGCNIQKFWLIEKQKTSLNRFLVTHMNS